MVEGERGGRGGREEPEVYLGAAEGSLFLCWDGTDDRDRVPGLQNLDKRT